MKKVKNLSQDIAFILIVLGIVAAINLVASWWFGRIDLSENHIYSVSPATKRMLQKLDDIINVNVYFSRNLPPQLKTLEDDVRDLLNEYQAYGGRNIRITWEDPSRNEEAKGRVRELGIPEVQLNTYERDKAQVINGYMGIAVLYSDKKELLPVVQKMENFEYDLTQAIMKVSRTSEPKVAVLKTDTTAYIPESVRQQMRIGQGDPTKEQFKPIFESLDANYNVELVSVREGEKIDSSFRTLIVPGGAQFTERMLYEIDQAFMNGANLIVLADAVKVSFEYGVTGAAQDTKLLSLLEHYGVRVEKSMVLDVMCGQVQVPQRIGMFQMNVMREYPYFVAIGPDGYNRKNPAVATLGGVIMPWVSPLTILVGSTDTTSKAAAGGLAVKSEMLISSSAKSWLVSDGFNLSPDQQWQIPTEGLKPHVLVAHLSGSFTSYFKDKPVPPVRETTDTLSQIQMSAASDANRVTKESNTNAHLVVAGDADFASAQNATPGNTALLVNLTDWLTLSDNLIDVRTRAMVDRFIQTDRLKAGSALPTVIRWVNIVTMPMLLALVGLLIFFRRREHIAAVPEKAGANDKEGKSA
jgi:ABC-2 type transport system permease protein